MTTNDKALPDLKSDSYIIDTHCHLDMKMYQEDLAKTIKDAADHGVARIVTIGIDLESSTRAVAISKMFSQVSATIGIHPHDARNSTDSDLSSLRDLFHTNPDCIVGYGEIGLDYAKLHSSKKLQKELFSCQLSLAADLGLPVIIHNRDADADTIDILRNAPPLKHGGIMHCFSGDYIFAKKVLDLGLLISVPGIVTFKNSAVLQDVVKRIPLSSMVLETDGPFLAPHPFRGKRNEPLYILYTAQKVAELKQASLAEVARRTSLNSETLFQF
ncbi:TatD family hydrolase [Desulfomarina sp.]